jgi:hypothetical protein
MLLSKDRLHTEALIVYPMLMPDWIIKRVNMTGAQEKQGQDFRFLNRCLEPYEWTDTVPEDDPEFQGLLEEEEAVAYPGILAELPGVELKSEEEDFQVVTDKPTPDFADLAAAALENAEIDPDEQLHQAHDVPGDVAPKGGERPALVEAKGGNVVYEITFDLPDAGLGMNAIPADKVGTGKAPIEIPDVRMNDATAVAHIPDVVPAAPTGRGYPT